MRPRKDVLLVMANEVQLGIWKWKLELWGYRVHAYESVGYALGHLETFPVFAAATSSPYAARRLHDVLSQVLLFGVKDEQSAARAGVRYELEGKDLPARVQQALKILVARKRGPAPLNAGAVAAVAQKKPVAALHAADALHATEELQQRRA